MTFNWKNIPKDHKLIVRNNEIKTGKDVKYLGVILETNGRFKKHIENVYKSIKLINILAQIMTK